MKCELQFVDTSNQFQVCVDGAARQRVIIGPIGGTISRAEALNLAAWIIALIEPTQEELTAYLKAIRQG